MTNFSIKNDIEFEVIHLANNQFCRYVYTSLFNFSVRFHGGGCKNTLTLLIDLYDGIHVTIVVKSVQIKIDDVEYTRTLRRSPKTPISHLQNVSRPKSCHKNWKNRRENESNSGGNTR